MNLTVSQVNGCIYCQSAHLVLGIEAKRELYLSNKTVKEVAYELGYEDEYYCSRCFKTNADVSPQLFRDAVGFARVMT